MEGCPTRKYANIHPAVHKYFRYSGFAVVDSLCILDPIVCGGSAFKLLFCHAVFSIFSSFETIFMGKRELVALH